MNCTIWKACVLPLFFGVAQAQTLPPVQPQPGLHLKLVDLEIRLKGVPTATNPSPTVRLITWTPDNIDAKEFHYTEPCWNKTSICPQVVGATITVFLRLPWTTSRFNVTNRVLCNGTECQLPAFTPIQAKPGESYQFKYNRITAQWVEAPQISGTPLPLPTVSPDGTQMPPATDILDADGAVWTQLPAIGGVAGQIGCARNGVRICNATFYLIISKGVVYQHDTDGDFRWTGTAWTPSTLP